MHKVVTDIVRADAKAIAALNGIGAWAGQETHGAQFDNLSTFGASPTIRCHIGNWLILLSGAGKIDYHLDCAFRYRESDTGRPRHGWER